MKKRKILFEDESTKLEEIENKNPIDSFNISDSISLKKSVLNKRITMSLEDAFETICGYMVSGFQNEIEPGKGTCKSCGTKTSRLQRHLCGDCMNKCCKSLIDQTKNAIKNKEDSIYIDL